MIIPYLSLALLLGACNCVDGTGPVVTETLMIDDVSGLNMQTSLDVRLKQGTPQSISLTAQQSLHDIIRVTAKDGICIVDAEQCFKTNKEAFLSITLPRMDMLSLDGSGNISGEGTFMVEDLEVDIDGSGNISVSVDAESLTLEIDGSGNISATGKTDELVAAIDGSGNIYAGDLKSASVEAEIDGSGDIEIGPSEDLNASVGGSGNIRYKGNPDVKSSVSGSGEISRY